MPIDPKAYKGRRIAPLPYDENNKPIPALFVPIVDPLTSEIAGYLPLRATDNGNGTATLKVDTEISVESVTLQNIKVGSSDGQVSGDQWLKVLPDGTVVATLNGGEDSALENGLAFGSVIFRMSAAAPENMALFVVGAKPVRLRRLDIDFNSGGNTIWQFYLNPAVTANGISVPGTNRHTVSLVAPTAVLYDAPTIAALGTLIDSFLTTAANRTPLNPIDVQWKLQSGERLLIRRVNTGAGSEAAIRVRWTEE